MCTVSFVPARDKVYITSNRDEKYWRLPALSPKSYHMNNTTMIFPKDGNAGGSWVTISSNGNAGVLLNGAFSKHEPKAFYSKSRGLVFLDIMDNDRPLMSFFKMELQEIEPFTLILWQHKNLYECRWDGKRRHCKSLLNYRPYIWSSATLYDDETVRKREYWFYKWLNRTPHPGSEEIQNFHRFAGDGDEENDLLMNRDGKVFTFSITSMELSEHVGSMHYKDVQTDQAIESSILFINQLTAAS